jgi:hypothetical protein
MMRRRPDRSGGTADGTEIGVRARRAASMNGELAPLRPRARLRVGVTGHRPGPKLPAKAEPVIKATVERLIAQLSPTLAGVVGETPWAFAAQPAELAVVSSLAEGADRIVAEAGLAASARLEVVLPAPKAIYQRDFATEASKAEFLALLSRASSVFELDVAAGPLGAKRGYEAAGLAMLAHADLLIAVWDEGEAAGIGGTAVIVERAVNEGAPVLLINPAASDEARLLWTGDMGAPPAETRLEILPHRPAGPALEQVVRALVAPPRDGRAAMALQTFYRERPSAADRGEPPAGGRLVDEVGAAVAPAYAAVDALAAHYGERRASRRRRLDYRRVATWIGCLGILALVGARLGIPRPRGFPAEHRQAGYDALENGDWVAWYVRAIERLLPVPDRMADADYLGRVRDAVMGTIADSAGAAASRLSGLRAAMAREPLEFARLSDRIQQAAEVMTSEAQGSPVLLRARPLGPPA